MIGLHIMRPTSVVVAGTGSSATVRADGGVDFSAATSLSLNGVFTADYDNYMLVWRGTNSAGQVNLQYRMRASGTDASGTNYTYEYVLANGTSVTSARTLTTFGWFGNSYQTQRSATTLYVYGPNLTQSTACRCVTATDLSSATIVDTASTHAVATAYDGITLYPSANAFDGVVTIYGYAQ